MPPTLVHGVDISTLEGWMVKINSNPSMFGKSLSRRWFRVSFVPAGNDQKLIISYSTNKTSKEPRGWLYIEDISGVYCRRDMIEVVSPARTLRFKGETTVEHRLWSDSLHKLCNQPKPDAPQEDKRLVAESAALHERQRERVRSQDRDRIADPKKTREFVDSSREPSDEAKPTQQVSTARKSFAEATSASSRNRAAASPPRRRASSPEQRDSHRRDRRNNSSDDDDHDHSASSEEEAEAAPPPRRRQSQESPPCERRVPDQTPASRDTKAMQSESPGVDSPPRSRGREDSPRRSPRDDVEEDESEGDERRRPRRDSDDSDNSEEDEEERPRRASATPLERRPSLLVASIKSLSPVVTTPAQPKSTTRSTLSESKASPSPTREASTVKRDAKAASHSDDEERDEEDPQKESPREEAARSPAQRTPATGTTKPQSTDYFDDEEGDEEDEGTNNKRRPSIPIAQAHTAEEFKVPTSEILADNNFAEDDWDAEDPAPAPSSTSKHRAIPEKREGASFGGVSADANFATEDWD